MRSLLGGLGDDPERLPSFNGQGLPKLRLEPNLPFSMVEPDTGRDSKYAAKILVAVLEPRCAGCTKP